MMPGEAGDVDALQAQAKARVIAFLTYLDPMTNTHNSSVSLRQGSLQ